MWILHRFQVDYLKMSQFTVISSTICFIWNVTFHAVLCSCTWIMQVTLCTVGLQWHKMNRKCPEHPSSSLLTTAAEGNKVSTGCYFLARFYCRQCCHSHAGIFKWNFDDFLWETGWNLKESRVMCGSRAWLICSILLDLPENLNIKINISFTNCLKCGNVRVICLICHLSFSSFYLRNCQIWRNLD